MKNKKNVSPFEEGEELEEELEDIVEFKKSQVDIFKENYPKAQYMVISQLKEDGIIYEIGKPWKKSEREDRTKLLVEKKVIKRVK